jgi:hypothetical protein
LRVPFFLGKNGVSTRGLVNTHSENALAEVKEALSLEATTKTTATTSWLGYGIHSHPSR